MGPSRLVRDPPRDGAADGPTAQLLPRGHAARQWPMYAFLGLLGLSFGLLGAVDLLTLPPGPLLEVPETLTAAAAGTAMRGVFRAAGGLGLAAVALGAVALGVARGRPVWGRRLLVAAGLLLLPGPSLFALAGAALLLLSAGYTARTARPRPKPPTPRPGTLAAPGAPLPAPGPGRPSVIG